MRRRWGGAGSVRAAGCVVAALAIVLSLAACSSGGATAPAISGAWVRPPQGTALPAAGYLVITGGSQADALLGASSPSAGMVMLHQTTTDASGMTGMQGVERLEVPAGATIALRPGGYHLMFTDVTGSLALGSTVQIDLRFEKAGKITVQAEVKQG